jgi:hypothetical protein
MIARAAEASGAGVRAFRRAGFTRTTTNLVGLVQDDSLDAVGVVEFEGMDGSPIVWSFADTDAAAPRYDRSMGVEVRFVQAPDETAVEYEASAPMNFEGLLNAIVQATKAEHERRFAGGTDIWLTGFRNANLPVGGDGEPGSLSLTLKLLRRMGREPQFQTYWTFDLVDRAGVLAPQTGAISFAYKSQAVSHGA